MTARPWAELSAIKLPARAPEAPVQARPPAVDARDGTNLLGLLSSALHADASVVAEAGARVPADAVRRMLESLQKPDGSVDAGQLVARIVEMSKEGGDTCEYRMDDGNDGDY